MGRTLYRECGPSQDRGPDPGNLPFFFFFFHFLSFFFYDLLVFPFYTKLINSLKVFTCILVFSLRYISERFSSNWQVYPFSTPLNSGHLSKEFGISLLFLFFLSFLILFFLLVSTFYARQYKQSGMYFYTRFFTSFHKRWLFPIISKFTLFLYTKIEDMHRNAAQFEP